MADEFHDVSKVRAGAPPRFRDLTAAIHWYQQSAISMARAAETAGMSRAEFLAELARRRVDVFVVDEQDLARGLRDA